MATNDEIRQSISQLEEQAKQLDSQTDQYKNIQTAISLLNEQLKKSVENLKEQVKQLELQKELQGLLSKETGITVDLKRKEYELQVQEYELQIKQKEKEIESEENSEKRLQLQKDLLVVLKKQAEETEKLKNLERAESSGKGLANLLGISESNKNSLTYQIFNDPKSVFDGFKKETFATGEVLEGFGSIGLSVLMKIQEATAIAFQQNDAAISSFVAATGATSAYNGVIVATARGNTALGISFQESGKAVTDLYTNLNTFTNLNKSAQEQLTVTTAKLEKLGISGAETAASIKTLSMAMGTSEVEASKVVENFAAMGQAMGVSSKQMISDFMQVKDQLYVFGSAIDETFIKLEAQSKATGVAINDLLSYTEKFDTFEGAADQVGKLNAVLGGPYLSAMSMIETTDPTERINMIRDAVNQAGMSFESMDYYQKKAIITAGGFKSAEEAQRILSMSAGEAADEIARQQASQEALNDAIKRAQPIQEKLSMIMANFAVIMGPVIEVVSDLLSKIVSLMDNKTFMLVIRSFLILGGVALAVAEPIGILIGSIVALVAAFVSLHDTLFVPHSPVLYDVLLALSTVFDSIGNAAMNMANSLMVVAQSFKMMHDGAIPSVVQFAEMASGITAIGMALKTLEDDKAINMKLMLEKIVQVSDPTTLTGFEKFSEKFDAVAQATAKIEVAKTNTFTQMLTATQNLSQALNLNQTVVVRIGSDKFKGVIEKIIDNKMPENATSSV